MEDLKLITDKVNEMFSPAGIWAVGGCVRDSLIGLTPKDFDFCTALLPDEIEAIIRKAGRRPYLIGKKFGTVGFKIEVAPHKFEKVEVTTFRSEIYETNNRRPTVVEFVTELQDDLSRRDFTMNAIAYRNGEFFDPFGGRLDILAKKIKPVGEATDRFKEDPLRMLRAARFTAQLEFEIDPNMVGKMRKMPDKILNVSRERWMEELDKLLVQDRWLDGIQTLFDTYMLRFMLPEVYLLYRDWGTDLPWKDMVDNGVEQRWAALLGFAGRPFTPVKEDKHGNFLWPDQQLIARELANGTAARLKWSNERKEKVFNLIERYK